MVTPETPSDMAKRLSVTMDIGTDEETASRLLPHLYWELGELMRRVGPDDLEPSELLGILGILAGVNSRLIVRGDRSRPLSGGRPGHLWIVPSG